MVYRSLSRVQVYEHVVTRCTCCLLPVGPHRPGQVPGATRGPRRCAGLCGGDRSGGLHGMLLTDPKEFKRSVWHSHTGQPSELQPPQAPERETEKAEKAATDAEQDEEFVQVVVEEVLLRGLERTHSPFGSWSFRLWSSIDFSLVCN